MDPARSMPAPPAADIRPILRPGRNCWRVETAERAGVLTNSDYFRALAAALVEAQQQVLLLGWDLDPGLILDPDATDDRRLPLGHFLAALCAARPGLQIRLLLWRRTILYGGSLRTAARLARLRRACPGLSVRFAPAPIASSLHQKLVCVDDRLAFVGGIDLAGDRWDHPHHPAETPHRRTPDGCGYGPIHDLHMAVSGPVAQALGELARARWARATGEKLAPPEAAGDRPVWPVACLAEFAQVPIGIARTDPANPRGPVREVETLNEDALARAERWIYLEAQYLAAQSIGDILAERLAEPDGPDVVVVVTHKSQGVLEQLVMGGNRDRLLRRLAAADRWDRLRVYYPVVGGGTEMRIHTKLVIVDDRFLRIGSSNLNNRSMAADSECDLALDAPDAAARHTIRRLLACLIGRHLECAATAVDRALHRTGSLVRAVEALNGGRLMPMPALAEPGPATPLPGSALLDPAEPISWRSFARALGVTLGLAAQPPARRLRRSRAARGPRRAESSSR